MKIKKLMSARDAEFKHRYLDDVKYIQKCLLEQGYKADLEMCASLWDEYSDSYAAGWLDLPDTSAEVLSCLEYFIEQRL